MSNQTKPLFANLVGCAERSEVHLCPDRRFPFEAHRTAPADKHPSKPYTGEGGDRRESCIFRLPSDLLPFSFRAGDRMQPAHFRFCESPPLSPFLTLSLPALTKAGVEARGSTPSPPHPTSRLSFLILSEDEGQAQGEASGAREPSTANQKISKQINTKPRTASNQPSIQSNRLILQP